MPGTGDRLPPPGSGPRDWTPPGWDDPWPARNEPWPARRRQSPRRIRAIALGSLVFALIVGALSWHAIGHRGGAPIAADRTPSAAGTAATVVGLTASADVGSCFDTAGTRTITVTFTACSTAHDDELVRIESATGSSAHFPSDAYWNGPVARRCEQDLLVYTGQPAERRPAGLRSSSFIPRPDGWAAGDRTVYCVAEYSPRATGTVRHLRPVRRSVIAPGPTPASATSQAPSNAADARLSGRLVVRTAGSDVCLALRPDDGPDVVLQSGTSQLSWLAETTSSGKGVDARSGIARGATPTVAGLVVHAGEQVVLTGGYEQSPAPMCGRSTVYAFSSVRG